MNRKLATVATLIIVSLVGACGQSDGDLYGKTGWADGDDFENMSTSNPRGDELNVSRLALFNNEIIVFTLLLKKSTLLGACDASEQGLNEQGATRFASVVGFEVSSQDTIIASYEIDAILLVGQHRETGEELAVGLFGLLGAQPLPDTAVDDFSIGNKLMVSVYDTCSEQKRETRYFNISGDVGEMLRTLEKRKADAQNAEVDQEFN